MLAKDLIGWHNIDQYGRVLGVRNEDALKSVPLELGTPWFQSKDHLSYAFDLLEQQKDIDVREPYVLD